MPIKILAFGVDTGFFVKGGTQLYGAEYIDVVKEYVGNTHIYEKRYAKKFGLDQLSQVQTTKTLSNKRISKATLVTKQNTKSKQKKKHQYSKEYKTITVKSLPFSKSILLKSRLATISTINVITELKAFRHVDEYENNIDATSYTYLEPFYNAVLLYITAYNKTYAKCTFLNQLYPISPPSFSINLLYELY